MATFATTADVTTLHTALAGYVTSITHSDATTQTVLRAQAQLALDKWGDAQLSLVSIGAASLDSYSNGVGTSAQRRKYDDQLGIADAAWDEFVRACAKGDVTVPTVDDSVAFWDLSRVSND